MLFGIPRFDSLTLVSLEAGEVIACNNRCTDMTMVDI
jgi:hypothetical protein